MSHDSTSRRHWNYRVMEFVDDDGQVTRAIHEVHYQNGRPTSYSENPAVIMWDAADDDTTTAPRILERMREALLLPALTEKDFPFSNPSQEIVQ